MRANVDDDGMDGMAMTVAEERKAMRTTSPDGSWLGCQCQHCELLMRGPSWLGWIDHDGWDWTMADWKDWGQLGPSRFMDLHVGEG